MPSAKRILLLAIASLPALFQPATAKACGGFFCNRPDNPFDPPVVVQTAENVLFAVNPDAPAGTPKIEAHIQIFYQGAADKFSWVLPVDAEPTLDVGSDTIFTTLDGLTRPQFQVSYHDEGICKPTPYQVNDATRGGTAQPGSVPPPTTPVPGLVDVSFRGAVGPFDAAVIHSTDPEALKQWLRDNLYFVSDQASGLIDTYVAENKYFVALKLLNGQDVTSIRPIVLRFNSNTPCVPLRLTAIAAVSDLRVNLWVLAARRTVPVNYLEIAVNPIRIDWLGGATNYDKVLADAANEAGGNAFTAEYAGPARLLDRKLWFDGKYNLPKLQAATTPPAYLNELAAQQFARDAKLLALLEKYIPEPASLVAMGISERDFYNRLSTYWTSNALEFIPFDPVAMTAELDATIVAPLARAQGLFDGYSYLTRLATFISPAEMTRDPIFSFNGDLGDVQAVRLADATYECGVMSYSRCDAPLRLRLPDGRTLRFMPPSASGTTCYPTYPRGDLDAMPALAAAWQRAESGPGTIVTDNARVIDQQVTDHNAKMQAGCGCSHAGGGTAPAGAEAVVFGLAILLRARRRKE